MPTRLRKTRKLRGGRHMGWGQVGQHRASGHKGGLGQSGMLKHHFSSMLKDEPDHFGHNALNPPQRNIIKKWTNVRDLDDLYSQYGKQENLEVLETMDGVKLVSIGPVVIRVVLVNLEC